MNDCKIICFDLDDTISNTGSLIMKNAEIYNNEVVKKAKSDKFIQSKDYYYFADYYNWSDDDIKSFFMMYYPKYLKELSCKSSASKVIKRLKKEGYCIHIITARPESDTYDIEMITKDWLNENGIEYDILQINLKNKSEYVKRCNASIFVDDSFDNCIKVLEETDSAVYLMDSEFNKGFFLYGISRVLGWNDLLIKILECTTKKGEENDCRKETK